MSIKNLNFQPNSFKTWCKRGVSTLVIARTLFTFTACSDNTLLGDTILENTGIIQVSNDKFVIVKQRLKNSDLTTYIDAISDDTVNPYDNIEFIPIYYYLTAEELNKAVSQSKEETDLITIYV